MRQARKRRQNTFRIRLSFAFGSRIEAMFELLSKLTVTLNGTFIDNALQQFGGNEPDNQDDGQPEQRLNQISEKRRQSRDLFEDVRIRIN
jgi:hypothetical protein